VKLESLTLREEEHQLRLFENRVLRRIVGPKRGEVAGSWKQHNEELHDLYTSSNIIRAIRSRMMSWAGHGKCGRVETCVQNFGWKI